MAELKYDPDTDTVQRIETLPSDAIDQQIAIYQAKIDEKTQEIKDLTQQIADLQPIADSRATAIAAKSQQAAQG